MIFNLFYIYIMADPITIINLIFTSLSIVLIPVIIKALDIIHDFLTHVKHSECCNCLKIDSKPDNIK